MGPSFVNPEEGRAQRIVQGGVSDMVTLERLTPCCKLFFLNTGNHADGRLFVDGIASQIFDVLDMLQFDFLPEGGTPYSRSATFGISAFGLSFG